ncbi:MAG: alpha/beta hydrolase [Burkholderiales bacterium]|nr:alpha/beta hydrolase [Burkholderiales bacterium]
MLRLALVLTCALLASACGGDGATKRTLALSECRLPRLATAAQCGTLEVPEDRSNPAGRKVSLFAAILPANTLTPKDDPLVILAGGPGQAASNLAPFAARLTELRRTRDVVLVDQRGTGRSSPLTCAAFKPRENDVFETDPLPRARECAAELKAKGIDAAQYTTSAWIADLESMREALGYRRWNLWGGSYGTRVAQEYLRRHPDRVRTAVLDGVAPPGMVIPLDLWRTREAAFAAVVATCKASPACVKAHPDIGASLAAIRSALGPDGREVDVADPRTGASERVRMTFDAVLAGLAPLTYAPETTVLLPEILALAAGGDFGPLLAANPSVSGRDAEQINAALYFSVTCAEDVPRIAPGRVEQELAGLATRRLAEQAIAVCEVWPRGSAPADFAQPLTSDVPVLLFSGGMDPVTPPAYGAEAAKRFAHSRHIVAPGYGHIVSLHACGPRLIASFVDSAKTDNLSATCITHFEKSVPPPLFVNRLSELPSALRASGSTRAWERPFARVARP